jgi:hypothetical protein
MAFRAADATEKLIVERLLTNRSKNKWEWEEKSKKLKGKERGNYIFSYISLQSELALLRSNGSRFTGAGRRLTGDRLCTYGQYVR